MADITISGVAVLVTSLTSSDLLIAERVSDSVTVKITKANLIGATITGGGTLALGGFTLTVPASGTVALLGTQQSFSQQQTIAPTDAGDDGLIMNMPTSSTNGVGWRVQYNGTSRIFAQAKSNLNNVSLAAFDNGAGVGSLFQIGRNSNASTPAPGALLVSKSDGNSQFLWPDDSAIWRTLNTQPTNATMGGGNRRGNTDEPY